MSVESSGNITCLEDIIKAAMSVGSKFNHDTEVWWRGQQKIDWKLQPRVIRNEHITLEHEQHIALRFKRQARSRHYALNPLRRTKR